MPFTWTYLLVRLQQCSSACSSMRGCLGIPDTGFCIFAGPVYEYITNKDGTVVGNYSLDLTVLDANTVQGKLPSSFDAESLLTDGSYTAVYTYYPTPNFTQPAPLTITFDITVCPFSMRHNILYRMQSSAA